MTNNDTDIVTCNDWVYDKSVFVSTAVSKVRETLYVVCHSYIHAYAGESAGVK